MVSVCHIKEWWGVSLMNGGNVSMRNGGGCVTKEWWECVTVRNDRSGTKKW